MDRTDEARELEEALQGALESVAPALTASVDLSLDPRLGSLSLEVTPRGAVNFRIAFFQGTVELFSEEYPGDVCLGLGPEDIEEAFLRNAEELNERVVADRKSSLEIQVLPVIEERVSRYLKRELGSSAVEDFYFELVDCRALATRDENPGGPWPDLAVVARRFDDDEFVASMRLDFFDPLRLFDDNGFAQRILTKLRIERDRAV